MSSAAVDLSIIIVSWNVAELLHACLASVYEHAGKLTLEVWVVDNASGDDSVEMVSAHFPQANLVALDSNVGFPKANNLVVHRCTGRYILYLNPDTVVHAHALPQLVTFMDRHLDVGLVGPKIVHPDGRIQYDCARNFPDLLGAFNEISFLRRVFPRSRIFGHQYMTYWDHLSSRDVPCLVGAAMLVRRETAAAVGWEMADQVYFEDLDYCYRVYRSPWRVYYLSDATVTHFGGESTSRSADRATFELHKWQSYATFFTRYKPYYQLPLLYFIVLLGALLRIVVLSAGMLLLKVFNKEHPFFSPFTLQKAIALLGWSLRLYRPTGL